MIDDQFEKLLRHALRRKEPSQTDVERVLKRLAGPLPRQKFALWRLPTVLLDWQFAPAWPRVAALAGCALIGFSIGIAGVDRSLATPDTQIASHDIGTMVFGPELFAETRP